MKNAEALAEKPNIVKTPAIAFILPEFGNSSISIIEIEIRIMLKMYNIFFIHQFLYFRCLNLLIYYILYIQISTTIYFFNFWFMNYIIFRFNAKD